MIKENDLPDGWEFVKLNEAITSISNGTTAQQNDDNKGYRVTRIETISKAIIDLTRTKFVKLDEKKYDQFKLNDGDILFSHINSTKHIGKTAIYNSNMGTLIHGMNLLRLIPKNDIIFPKFLLYRLKNKDSLSYFQTRCKKSVNQSSLDQKMIKNFEFILPPLQTQKKIVAILEKAERLKEWRKEADELTDEFLKSTFLEMFGDPMRNPKGWKKQKFKNIVNEFRYGSSNKSTETGYPILRIPNVVGNVINLHNLKYSEVTPNEYEKLKLFEGDILFVRTNGNQNYVGRCAIVDKIHVNFIYASYLIRARINEGIILPEYLKNYLYTEYAKQLVKSRTRTSAGQYNINTVGLGLIDILTPPLELQQKFESIVQRVEQLREHQSQSRQHIDDLFNVLMQKAFKGELV